MRYGDQLARHHPFKIAPPAEFAPFAHRLVLEVQNLLRRSGLKKTDPHRIAQLFDIHLNELASHFSRSQKNKSTLLRQGYPPEVRRAVRATKDAQVLRRLVPDLDLYKARQFLVPHLLDVPAGVAAVPSFVKVGILALWKAADAIDAASAGRSKTAAIHEAIAFALEAMDAAQFALQLFESEVLALEESGLVADAQLQGAEDQVVAAKRVAYYSGLRKGEGRRVRYAFIRMLSLEIANEHKYSKLEVAEEEIPPLMMSEYGLRTTPSSVRAYLCDQGWKAFRPNKTMKSGSVS